jgi:hypothetical protein
MQEELRSLCFASTVGISVFLERKGIGYLDELFGFGLGDCLDEVSAVLGDEKLLPAFASLRIERLLST